MNILFWNVDTQKDFMLSSGKLYIKNAETIISNLKKLTEFAQNFNIKVVNTGDYHTLESEEISNNPDFVNTFPSHCIAGEEGQEFINETYPKNKEDNYYIVNLNDKEINETIFKRARNIIIFKNYFDVFKENNLIDKILKLLNPQIIFVYGVASNVCVNFAVQGLVSRGYKVIVIKNAIKELPNSSVENIFNEWKSFNVILETTENIIKNIPKLL